MTSPTTQLDCIVVRGGVEEIAHRIGRDSALVIVPHGASDSTRTSNFCIRFVPSESRRNGTMDAAAILENDTETYYVLDDRLEPVEATKEEWTAFLKTDAATIAITHV